jgi:glucan phosphorylase
MTGKEQDFKDFLDCLKAACESMNDEHYFQIGEAESTELKYRERVYCYELYHQLRNRLGDQYAYKIDGELDKSGHPIIKPCIPDFVVHEPKSMERNLLVVEVKHIQNELPRLKRDISKLKKFLRKYSYDNAIMLIYSKDEDIDVYEPKIAKLKANLGDYTDKIRILVHPGPGKAFIEMNDSNNCCTPRQL